MPYVEQLPQETPNTLLEMLVRFWDKYTSESLHCAKIAIIETYDPAKRMCSCKLAVRDKNNLGWQGEKTQLLFQDIPVMFPYASGGRLHFPLKAGDAVLLIGLDADSQNWLWNHTDSSCQTYPTHSFISIIAIPGIVTNVNGVPTKQFSETDVLLQSDTNINVEASQNVSIKAGSTINVEASQNVSIKAGSTAGMEAGVAKVEAQNEGGTVNIAGTGGGLGACLSELLTLMSSMHPAQADQINAINTKLRTILK